MEEVSSSSDIVVAAPAAAPVAPVLKKRPISDLSSLEKFLEKDKLNNKNEPWCKLNKTVKTQKLVEYVTKSNYCRENQLDETDTNDLISYLRDALDRKKLHRVKDVVYDRVTGEVKDIPALVYNKTAKKFTLRNMDNKHVSTLKSLGPKRKPVATTDP
jgi:hypothetical protein